MMLVAQRFPRIVEDCKADILKECERPDLAAMAEYEYPKGGSEISGPSIRLAEMMANNWRNMTYELRELDNSGGKSVVLARAWDLQKNVQSRREFTVSHKRFTRNGSYDLTDQREIYELVANYGQRRVRACILQVIPGDVVEAARKKCDQVLMARIVNVQDALNGAIEEFGRFGIDEKMIAETLGRGLDSVTPRNIMRLRRIYASLIDGIGRPENFFKMEKVSPAQRDEIASKHSEMLRNRITGKGIKGKAQEPNKEQASEQEKQQPPKEEAKPSKSKPTKEKGDDGLDDAV